MHGGSSSYAALKASSVFVNSLNARQLLHAAARVRRMVTSYARGMLASILHVRFLLRAV